MTIDPHHAQPHPGGPMSVEEYLRLDRSAYNARYEYIDGVARLMSGGSAAHNRIARNIARFTEDQFRSGPCTVFGSDMQVLIGIKPGGQNLYCYPDVTITCDVADRRRDCILIESPRIVIEVLSPSTEYLDRGKKLKAYQACPTIQEIVLINQFARRVEIYRRATEDQQHWEYIVYEADDIVELASVDIHLIMDEIYQDIDFEQPIIGN